MVSALEQQSTKILSRLIATLITIAHPLIFVFAQMNYVPISVFYQFLVGGLILAVALLVGNRLLGHRPSGKYVQVTLTYLVLALVLMTLPSPIIWTIAYLYLTISIVYLIPRLVVLAGIFGLLEMALFTANGTIVFTNTFDLIVAYVIYLMIFSAAVFVAVFGRNVMQAVRQEQERSEAYAATSQVALEQTAATATEVTTFTEEMSETVDAAKDSFSQVDMAMQQLAHDAAGSVQAIREIRQLNDQQVNRMEDVTVSVDRALERSSSSRTTAERSRQTIGLAGQSLQQLTDSSLDVSKKSSRLRRALMQLRLRQTCSVLTRRSKQPALVSSEKASRSSRKKFATCQRRRQKRQKKSMRLSNVSIKTSHKPVTRFMPVRHCYVSRKNAWQRVS